MPIADLRVDGYSYRQGVHAWLVMDNTNPSAEFAKYNEVRFYNADSYGSAPEEFVCDCYKRAPRSAMYVCDHVMAVAQYITRKSGKWEADSTLMGVAWKLGKRLTEPVKPVQWTADFRFAGGEITKANERIREQIAKSMRDQVDKMFKDRGFGVDLGAETGDESIEIIVTPRPVKKPSRRNPEEPKPHEPPEEPKKPRNRFTEVDL